MCRAVRCRTCGKIGWSGCGRHVQQVMAQVPKAEQCPGHPKAEGEGGWRKLFGR